jgi:hypothetical protein
MYKSTIGELENYSGDKIIYSNKRLSIKELRKLTGLQFTAKEVKVEEIKLMKVYDDESKKAKRVPIPGHPGLYTFSNIDTSPENMERAKRVVDEIIAEAERMGRERREQP